MGSKLVQLSEIINDKVKLVPSINDGLLEVDMYLFDATIHKFIDTPLRLEFEHLYGFSVDVRELLRNNKTVIVRLIRNGYTAYQPDIEIK